MAKKTTRSLGDMLSKKNGDRAPDQLQLRGETLRKKGPNANYNFSVQQEPITRMGDKDFANMPENPKYLRFDNRSSYRDGIINSFTFGITEVSDIHENEATARYTDGNATAKR